MPGLYEPLDVETYEVRMLTLTLGSTSPTVECTMKRCSLVRNPPQYIALSYCWGNANITKDIIVNGVTMPVTVNLEQALRRLRNTLDDGLSLWVDALCINQKDSQERSQQVRLMKHIFEKAKMCYAWLGGEELTDIVSGMRSVKDLTESDSGQGVAPANGLLHSASSGLLSICSSAYWQRRWVIQELTVASNVRVICGTDTLALELLQSAYSKCSASEFWLSEHQVVSASFDLILQFRLRYHEGELLELTEAILSTQQYLSMDPRDKVFAMIGICSDGPTLVPTPNYTQSADEVSRDLTRAILLRNANFDMIWSDPRRRKPSVSLPTWAPDWCSSDLPQSIRSSTNLTHFWHRCFTTSTSRADVETLEMEGLTIGTVVALTSSLCWDMWIGSHCPVSSQSLSLDHQACTLYYGSRSNVTSALIQIIMTARSLNPFLAVSNMFSSTTIKHIFLWSNRFKICQNTQQTSRDPISTFSSWLRINENFRIEGDSIAESLRLRYLDTKLFIVLVFYLIISASVFIALFTAVTKCSLQTRTFGWTSECVFVVVPLFVFALLLGGPTCLEIMFYFDDGVALPHWINDAKALLSEQIDCHLRVFILDQGILGSTSVDVKIGDRICFLVGCSRAVILRRRTEHETTQYYVVGAAGTKLNRADRRKYRVWSRFDDYRGHMPFWKMWLGSFDTPNREKYRILLDTYRKSDWWERFTLV